MKLASVKVTFEPEGRHSDANLDETILQIANRLGLQLRSECGGKGTCGKCRVQINPQSGLNQPTPPEYAKLSDKHRKAGFRLACQAYINGTQDLTVTIPTTTRGLRRRVQVQGVMQPVSLRPAIRAIVIDVPAANLDRPIPDTERVITTLSNQLGFKSLPHWDYPIPVIIKTPQAVRNARGHVTVIIHNRTHIVDITAGDTRENIYGVAFDIGTSKLVGSLYSLATGNLVATTGVENPQLRFGEDIMIRLHYAAVSTETRQELQSVVINGLNSVLHSLTSTGIPLDHIYEVVVVGNTVMTSLFLGVDTTHLAYGPFVPPYRGPIETPSGPLALHIPPQSVVYILPNVAGFVGADAVANILSTGIHRHRKPSLLIDIGTNSEVILGNRERISATSCAAGPAFEGAQIEHGMKAVSGAIERVTLNAESMKFQLTTVDEFEPIGICGSGVVDAIAQLKDADLLSKKGRFTKHAHPYITTKGNHRFITLHPNEQTKDHSPITLSEHDISQLLLAKAAIQTGYTLLMHHHTLGAEDLDKIFIAGAFGNYLNPASARRIGLIPDVPLRKVTFVGNAAIAGAQLALLSTSHRRTATQIAKTTEFVDLARHPEFNKVYAASLFL